MSLKNNTENLLADPADFLTPAFLITVPAGAKVPAQITFRHFGAFGSWYIKFNRVDDGPSDEDYSHKIGPGEAFTEPNPPFGDVWALATEDVDEDMSVYLSYKS